MFHLIYLKKYIVDVNREAVCDMTLNEEQSIEFSQAVSEQVIFSPPIFFLLRFFKKTWIFYIQLLIYQILSIGMNCFWTTYRCGEWLENR
jgi:hypothetical protein